MARESSTADFRLLEAMHDRTPLARSLAALVLDHLFPRFCLGCGTRLAGGTSPLLLCPPCRGRLERVDPRSTCSGCVRPLPAGRLSQPRCLDCLRDPPPFDRLVAVWRYRPPLDRVLWAFFEMNLNTDGGVGADGINARLGVMLDVSTWVRNTLLKPRRPATPAPAVAPTTK